MIEATQGAIIARLSPCFTGVDIDSGPGLWDGSYLNRLLPTLPAIRVVFDGAGNEEPSSTDVTLNARWLVYCITGWRGRDEKSRRLGDGAAYAMVQRCVGALHGELLKDPDGDRLSRIAVDEIENLWSASWDLASIAVYSANFTTELPIDVDPAYCTAALDNFLTAGLRIEPTDPDGADIVGDFDLPQ